MPYSEIFYEVLSEETPKGRRPYPFRVIADVRHMGNQMGWLGTIAPLDPIPEEGAWYFVMRVFGYRFADPPPRQVTAVAEFESEKKAIREVKKVMREYNYLQY